MPKSAAAEKSEQARAASRLLADVPGVKGVALFGSVARGDAVASSDIDLIVLGTSEELTSSALRRCLSPSLSGVDISVRYHTPASLETYLAHWSRFGAHLRIEGRILYDMNGDLSRILTAERPIETKYEFAAQERHLARYAHADRFGGRFLFPLAHLYRIGRTAAFAAIAKEGRLEFDRRQAFEIAADLYPDLSEEFATIAALAPFYEYVRAPQSGATLPFDPVGPAAEVGFLTARTCVSRVIAIGTRE